MSQSFMIFLQIVGGIAGVITILKYSWKIVVYVRNYKSLSSAIKCISSLLHLTEIRDSLSDIYSRIFQLGVKGGQNQSLQEYVNSFGSWESKSGSGIKELSVKIDNGTETYKNVTGVRTFRIDPFSPLYGLEIECDKEGYALYTKCIMGVSPDEIPKAVKPCYYKEIVENQISMN